MNQVRNHVCGRPESSAPNARVSDSSMVAGGIPSAFCAALLRFCGLTLATRSWLASMAASTSSSSARSPPASASSCSDEQRSPNTTVGTRCRRARQLFPAPAPNARSAAPRATASGPTEWRARAVRPQAGAQIVGESLGPAAVRRGRAQPPQRRLDGRAERRPEEPVDEIGVPAHALIELGQAAELTVECVGDPRRAVTLAPGVLISFRAP